jgi:hypothetical protein
MYLKHMRPYQLSEAVAQGHPLMLPAGWSAATINGA